MIKLLKDGNEKTVWVEFWSVGDDTNPPTPKTGSDDNTFTPEKTIFFVQGGEPAQISATFVYNSTYEKWGTQLADDLFSVGTSGEIYIKDPSIEPASVEFEVSVPNLDRFIKLFLKGNITKVSSGSGFQVTLTDPDDSSALVFALDAAGNRIFHSITWS